MYTLECEMILFFIRFYGRIAAAIGLAFPFMCTHMSKYKFINCKRSIEHEYFHLVYNSNGKMFGPTFLF